MTTPRETAEKLADRWWKSTEAHTLVSLKDALKLQDLITATLEAAERAGYERGIEEAAEVCKAYAFSNGTGMMRRQVAYACETRIRALKDVKP